MWRRLKRPSLKQRVLPSSASLNLHLTLDYVLYRSVFGTSATNTGLTSSDRSIMRKRGREREKRERKGTNGIARKSNQLWFLRSEVIGEAGCLSDLFLCELICWCSRCCIFVSFRLTWYLVQIYAVTRSSNCSKNDDQEKKETVAHATWRWFVVPGRGRGRDRGGAQHGLRH